MTIRDFTKPPEEVGAETVPSLENEREKGELVLQLVLDKEVSEKIASRLTEEAVVEAVRRHIRDTGNSGLAGDILKNLG